ATPRRTASTRLGTASSATPCRSISPPTAARSSPLPSWPLAGTAAGRRPACPPTGVLASTASPRCPDHCPRSRGPDMTTHPTPPEHGIIAGLDHTDEVRAAGSDYTELTVVGSLLVEDEAGAWGPPAGARPAPEAPSFAILCPSTLALSDPAGPPAEAAHPPRPATTGRAA